MTLANIAGRAWMFGDNLDTDQMAPFVTFTASWEETRPQMFPGRPDFTRDFATGDILVAGKNFGCGSSREQAPNNLKRLGVGVIVAESFGRIFYRNAVALALPVLACPGVSSAVSEGDQVEVDLTKGLVRNLTTGMELHGFAPTADMLRIFDAGGLLNTLSAGYQTSPRAKRPAKPAPRPHTMAEKILARASGQADVTPGQYVTAKVDRLVVAEFLASCASRLRKIGVTQAWDPDRVCTTTTAVFPAPTPDIASLHNKVRSLAEQFGITRFYPHDGIINQVIVEKGDARPGELIFGSDSHSTTYGAVGAAGAGLGITELAYVLATGEIWVRVPETIRFVLTGTPPPGVMSKDLILHLLARFGTDYAQYKAIEYAGPLAERMSLSSRMTLSNMSLEMGAKFAMFAADETTLKFLRSRVDALLTPFGPDAGATYAAEHRIDVSQLKPQVARPHNPGNVGPIDDALGVRVDQAFLGSCTNARLEDLAVAARILEGRKVHSRTRLMVTPSSREVMIAATKAGYLEILLEAGAHFTPPGCGKGEICISTTNRNFMGRMGSPDASIYLASPATVAAAAIAGKIVDPRDYWSENGLELDTISAGRISEAASA